MASQPCRIDSFDEHGFAVFSAHEVKSHRPDTERCHDYSAIRFPEEHKKKWEKFLSEWDDSDINNPENLFFIKQGVPAQYRPRLWTNLLEIESLKLCNSFHYQAELENVREQLVELGISEFSGGNAVTRLCEAEDEEQYVVRPGQISMSALRHILLDLERTYPTHMLFLSRDGEGKEGRAALFRVLATYARYNKSVEYCQGMSAIAGMFVMYLSEEDAFWCLVSLLERHKYLVGYFSIDMSRLRKHADVFDKLLYQRLTLLQRHLERQHIKPLMYVTPWFLCLFTNLQCWDTVLTIWDLLLLEGYKTLFRVGLAILDLFSTELLACDNMSELLPKLLRLPPHIIRHETLIPKVHSTIVEEWEINCLLSIVDEEERIVMEEEAEQNGGGTTSAASNLGVGTLPGMRGQKRKGSALSANSSDGGVFQFRGRDTRASKRQKIDIISPSRPSFLSRLRNMFRGDCARSRKTGQQSSLSKNQKFQPKPMTGYQSHKSENTEFQYGQQARRRRSSQSRRSGLTSVSASPVQSNSTPKGRRKSGLQFKCGEKQKENIPLPQDTDTPLSSVSTNHRINELRKDTPVRRSPRLNTNLCILNDKETFPAPVQLQFNFSSPSSKMNPGAEKTESGQSLRHPLIENTTRLKTIPVKRRSSLSSKMTKATFCDRLTHTRGHKARHHVQPN